MTCLLLLLLIQKLLMLSLQWRQLPQITQKYYYTSIPNTTAEDNTFHYLIIDSTILQTILDIVGKCPKCHCKDLLFKNSATQKKGLANFIHISCNAVILFIQLIAANKLFLNDYLDKTLSIQMLVL